MHCYYILQGKTPVPVDPVRWGYWFENMDNRRILLTEQDGARVSTIFLGLNHNFTGEGEPILFETMVFGGKYDDTYQRYSGYDEAIAGHQLWCALVFPAPVQ